ncbi:MAG: DUF305 domain-containing protein [Umezawaea sp.]
MRARLLVALVGFVVLVSGCSIASGTAATQAGANDTDIRFLWDMVPHHKQTLEISSLVRSRSKNPEVIKVADAITAEGTSEIDKMNGWLTEWKVAVADSGHQAHEMVVSPKDVDQLSGYNGADFDKQWAALMGRHLRDGVQMAESVSTGGTHQGVRALSKEMITVQNGLIADLDKA